MDHQLIVRQAANAFQSGKYNIALDLYQKAAETLGGTLFEANISLCKRRLNHTDTEQAPPQQASVEEQLQHTQQLLEHYFIRSQELEYQLFDNK